MRTPKSEEQRLYIEAIRKHIENKYDTPMCVVLSSGFANTKTCDNNFLMIVEASANIAAVDFTDDEGLVMLDPQSEKIESRLCHIILWDSEFTEDETGRLYMDKTGAKNGVLVIDENCIDSIEFGDIATLHSV